MGTLDHPSPPLQTSSGFPSPAVLSKHNLKQNHNLAHPVNAIPPQHTTLYPTRESHRALRSSAGSPSNIEISQSLLIGGSPNLMLLSCEIQTDSLEYQRMEKLGQWSIYLVNPRRTSSCWVFFLNHTPYLTCHKELHGIHSCQLVLRTLKYLLVRY